MNNSGYPTNLTSPTRDDHATSGPISPHTFTSTLEHETAPIRRYSYSSSTSTARRSPTPSFYRNTDVAHGHPHSMANGNDYHEKQYGAGAHYNALGAAEGRSHPSMYAAETPVETTTTKAERRYLGGRLSRRGCLFASTCGIISLLLLVIGLPLFFFVILPIFVRDVFRKLGTAQGTKFYIAELSVTNITDSGLHLRTTMDIQGKPSFLLGRYGEVEPSFFRVVGDLDGKEYATMDLKEKIDLQQDGIYRLNLDDMEIGFPSNGHAFRGYFEDTFLGANVIPKTAMKIVSNLNLKFYGIDLIPIAVERPFTLESADLKPFIEKMTKTLGEAMKGTANNKTDTIEPAPEESDSITKTAGKGVLSLEVVKSNLTSAIEQLKELMSPGDLLKNTLQKQPNGASSAAIKLADVLLQMDFLQSPDIFVVAQPFDIKIGSFKADVSLDHKKVCTVIAEPITIERGNQTSALEIKLFAEQSDLLDMIPLAGKLLVGAGNQTSLLRIDNLVLTDSSRRVPAWVAGILSAFHVEAELPVPDIALSQGDFLQKIMDGLKTKLEEKFNEVKDRVKNKIDDVKSNVKDRIVGVKDRITDTVSDKVDSVKETVSDLKDKLNPFD